jgi:CRISPR/Cas system-associated endoribonuclease Cas2
VFVCARSGGANCWQLSVFVCVCVCAAARFLIVDQFRLCESERDCFICVPVKNANALTKESLSFDFLMAVGGRQKINKLAGGSLE